MSTWALAKSAIKPIVLALGKGPMRPILGLKAAKRMLGSTLLYPDWVRNMRHTTARWKSESPDWTTILQQDANRWRSFRDAAKNGPRVLMALSTAGTSGSNTIESMLAVALTLRGAEVHILLCDEHLPACFLQNIYNFPDAEDFATYGPSPHMCSGCFLTGQMIFQSLGLPTHRHSDLISRKKFKEARDLSVGLPIAEIEDYRADGVAVGEHALASAVHFYARGDLQGEPHGEAVLRRYFHAALLTMYESRRLLNTYSFDCACFHHGIYVPHGPFNEVARQEDVRTVTWSPAYRNQTFVFSHHDTYHRTMLSEPTTSWENMPWTPEMEAEILDYLKSRWYGTHDWICYQDNTQDDGSAISADLGIDPSRPCIGLLTNIMWDAQVHYRANAFRNMLEWVFETIRYFISRQDLQLIIRVHPAEVQHGLKSRQPIINEIQRAFPTLPKNVFIIPPDKPINTYAAMLQCDTVIVYATKTGVELTSIGIPVIVAGEAWVRNKGITLDASSPEEYFQLLDRLPLRERLDEAISQRARKYAYHFFFRRMIPLPFIIPPWPYRLNVSGLDDLLPGRSVGLDVICNGILSGDEFIYPAERRPEPFYNRLTTTSERPGRMRRVGAI